MRVTAGTLKTLKGYELYPVIGFLVFCGKLDITFLLHNKTKMYLILLSVRMLNVNVL